MADQLDDAEITGTIRTPRHERVRFRLGHECGDLFEDGVEYDGPTLTIETSGHLDALAMIAAISAPRHNAVLALVTAAATLRDHLTRWVDGGAVATAEESEAMYLALDRALRPFEIAELGALDAV